MEIQSTRLKQVKKQQKMTLGVSIKTPLVFQLFSFTHSRFTYTIVGFLYGADSSSGSTDSKESLCNPKVNFSAFLSVKSTSVRSTAKHTNFSIRKPFRIG